MRRQPLFAVRGILSLGASGWVARPTESGGTPEGKAARPAPQILPVAEPGNRFWGSVRSACGLSFQQTSDHGETFP